jgi:hypothetical protein
MIVKIENTRFDVTHITELEGLPYFYALKHNKGYTDGGGERSHAESCTL